jgi:adenylylsulfate kinase
MAGCTLWLTGLSGAGKSTISKLVETELRKRDCKVEVLDGDIIRTHLSKGLGFSKEDRDINIKRIAFVCGLLTRNDVIALAAAISPYKEARDYARETIGNFIEIFVNCPVDVCMERDTKGLYKKALAGEISNFTGVSDPYEEPDRPDLVINTHEETPEASAGRIIKHLEELGYIPVTAEEVYSEEEKAELAKRLADLGYM